MAYVKPEVLAQNSAEGSFAAGCPVNKRGSSSCRDCELTQ